MKDRGTRADRQRDATQAGGRAGKRARRPKRFRLLRFVVKGGLTLVMLLILIAGAGFMAVESGALDKTLTARAEGALNGAIGPRYLARVGKTAIRFAGNRQLAIEARDVVMVDQQTGRTVSETAAIRMALDPFRLIAGELNINRIEADNVRFDTALFASGTRFDLSRFRIDSIPALVETGFAQLDLFGGFVDRARTDSLGVNGMQLLAAQPDGKTLPVGSASFSLIRQPGGSLALDGSLVVEADTVPFSIKAQRKLGKTVSVKARLSGIPLQHFGAAPQPDGSSPDTLLASAATELSATRASVSVSPAISLAVVANPGTLRIHGIEQAFDGATVNAAYDFAKNSLEVLPSSMSFGQTSLPFTGGLIDLDRLKPASPKGFGVDLLVKGGKAYTEGAGAVPIAVAAQATGAYYADTGELALDRVVAGTDAGSLIGSLKVKFGGPDPEISFAAQTENVQTQTVKQLWPFWIAPRARHWVSGNLYGGAIANGSLAVFLPAVRPRNADGTLLLNGDQLDISFDITNARLNIAGDIPPLRGTTGHFEIKGAKVVVDIKSGTSYFPTDRSVAIEGGTFTIPDIDIHPLTAQMAVTVSGAADAVAELITYRPIKYLSRVGLAPGDVIGNIRADVQASFGLNAADEIKPQWKAAMALNNVDLLKPIEGRRMTGLTGTLDIDPMAANLVARGKIDGVPMELTATEPVGQESKVERRRAMTMTLADEDIARLLPHMGDVLGGSIKAQVALMPAGVQKIEADLTRATLKVPGTGWTKGSGIAAKANFDLRKDGDLVDVSNLQISGDGFGVSGKLQARAGKLVQASFDKVKLSANDDFSLRVKPVRSGYDVAISGHSADVRAAIARLRSAGTSADPTPPKFSLLLRAKLDTLYGFGDEKLHAFEIAYAPVSANSGKFQLSAVTSSGQAVVGQVVDDANGHFIQLTSGDAGATFRFLGLYSRVKKGLLNTRIRPGRSGSWTGNIDIREFQLANEERLQTIVSTPTGADGRSLNKAVKRDIDVSSERFQRGFAYFTYADGALQIANGILRGTQVGATFQGTVRDPNGKIDVTGTFMPAYGLNRLFAELPIIGIILGNGRDRGLLGITFKLTGPFDKPNLTINPLSIIAPGIFRQIFEFQ